MLYTEWDLDEALAVRYEEGTEKGIEIGIDKERQSVLDMFDQGLSPEEIKQRLQTAMSK